MRSLFLFSCVILTIHARPRKPVPDNCDSEWLGLPHYNTPADRVYYIACVDTEWDYAPSGNNEVKGEPITPTSEEAIWLLGNRVDRIGSKYLKALYREFTNNCFTEQKQPDPRDVHLGAVGPTIRALTGERIKVFYRNTCQFPNSMHPHGVIYDKLSEGAPYNDQSVDGDIVQPGDSWVYIWDARVTNVDPGSSSGLWLYHSHVDEVKDVYAGLFGAIIITRNGEEIDTENDLRPKDVDREFVTFFVLYNENESHYVEQNVEQYLDQRTQTAEELLQDEDFVESNLMHSINGYLFGNLDTLICKHKEVVRWYTASFGNELDGPHSPHWHGNIGEEYGKEKDTVVIIPGTTSILTMDVDQPGKWLYHCHVHDHIVAGMITTYTAEESDGDFCCCGTNNLFCQYVAERDVCFQQAGCAWDTNQCQRVPPQQIF